jgi:hypothetical protein
MKTKKFKIKTPKKRGSEFIYKWSSHLPVVNAFLELLSPKLVVELGVGRYSTPYFLNYSAKKTLHIDNEPGWLDLVQKENKDIIKNNNEFRLHDLSDLNIETLRVLPGELNDYQTTKIIEYYQKLSKEIKSYDCTSMIFTDGFASCRKASVDVLTKDTDVMIFHDAEKPSAYGYDNLDKNIYITHREYLLKTKSSWTGFLVKKELFSYLELSKIIDKHVDVYVRNLEISKEGFELVQMNVDL